MASNPGHPGQQVMMVTSRDLLLFQLNAWQSGLELGNESACEAQDGMTPSKCKDTSVHIEYEAGADSETIRVHTYYDDKNKMVAMSVNNKIAMNKTILPMLISAWPAWIKWERKDNGDPPTALK